MKKINVEETFIEEYSEERIAEFLKEDRLDKETAKKVRRIP